MTANLFDGPPDFEHEGVTCVALQGEPARSWADLHHLYANEELLVLEGTPTRCSS